jgi:hypothetical protein
MGKTALVNALETGFTIDQQQQEQSAILPPCTHNKVFSGRSMLSHLPLNFMRETV